MAIWITPNVFFANTRADIRHGGKSPFYRLCANLIRMPPFEAFRDRSA
jgi:antirestriction protein ArdC